jgi:hypothetical protein
MPSLIVPSDEEETVSINVQGCLFVLREDLILAHDWMPAKMLTSEISFQKIGGLHYLDVDSSSFRMILSILSGVADLEQAVSRLPPMDLSLLISLLCLDLVDTLEEMQMKNFTVEESLNKKVELLKEELISSKKSSAQELAKVKKSFATDLRVEQRKQGDRSDEKLKKEKEWHNERFREMEKMYTNEREAKLRAEQAWSFF